MFINDHFIHAFDIDVKLFVLIKRHPNAHFISSSKNENAPDLWRCFRIS